MPVKETVPRPEYPRPQMRRGEWMNLNGEWEFEVDHGRSGRDRGLPGARELSGTIVVPFCPESELSGVGRRDFMEAAWYRREFEVPASWLEEGRRVLLHFGAVDYEAEVWINGTRAGGHRGGYTSFTLDITPHTRSGRNVLVVCAEDDLRSGRQPAGKQCPDYHSRGCHYTRTTGIWQTVWLESVPRTHIEGLKYIPDPVNARLHLEVRIAGKTRGAELELLANYDGRTVGRARVDCGGPVLKVALELEEVHLWGPGEPLLYDLNLSLMGGGDRDRVESYFGLRTVTIEGRKILINGRPVFQRLVLDQGFYPDGIYTAPSDAALRRDIEIARGLGFNGARLHEKIFEPRFLYWADCMGYLVWEEHANWGLDLSRPGALERFLPEWLEAMGRDFNHPAIIGWCPFNETQRNQNDEVVRAVYRASRAFDGTRPVIDTSGYFHVETDVFDVHDYEQDPEVFADRYASLDLEGEVHRNFPDDQRYGGQPYFVSEYGGIWWNPAQEGGWGYGERPQSEGEFIGRYRDLTHTLLENPDICGFCYTQLYDIEQEVNGLYTYDRQPKFDPEIFREINTRKAAIEED